MSQFVSIERQKRSELIINKSKLWYKSVYLNVGIKAKWILPAASVKHYFLMNFDAFNHLITRSHRCLLLCGHTGAQRLRERPRSPAEVPAAGTEQRNTGEQVFTSEMRRTVAQTRLTRARRRTEAAARRRNVRFCGEGTENKQLFPNKHCQPAQLVWNNKRTRWWGGGSCLREKTKEERNVSRFLPPNEQCHVYLNC